MFYGAGSLHVISKDLSANSLRGENILHPLSIASFELAFDDKNIEAKALIDGKRQVVASAISESSAKLTLVYEYSDWQTLGLALADELPVASSNITWNSLKSKIAVKTNGTPSVAEVVDAGFTGLEVVGEDIYVYVASQGPWGDRKYLKASEVTVDEGKLILPAIFAGAIIQYTVQEVYSSIETLGLAPNYDNIGTLAFQGVIAGTETGKRGLGIIVPQITRVKTPNLKINGDLAEMTVEYRAEVPEGKRSAFELYNLSTGTLV